MAKKKKKSNRNDARGYATSNTSNHKGKNQKKQETLEKVGKSTKSIQVTNKAYHELTNLLDELKKSMYGDDDINTICGGSGGDTEFDKKGKKTRKPIIHVSMDNKRFVKKVTFLNDNLQQLGFNNDQIKRVLVALIFGQRISKDKFHTKNATAAVNGTNVLSLDDALDWLCFHLQSDDLPKLFTDINLRQDDDTDMSISKLSVIKAAVFAHAHAHASEKGDEGKEDDKDEWEEVVEEKQGDGSNNDNLLIQNNTIEREKQRIEAEAFEKEEEAKEIARRKAWLVSQYQFEDEDIEQQDGNERNNKHDDSATRSKKIDAEEEEEEEEEEERPKFPEEIRLEKLEIDIKETQESVNDEASNYMRSKYEIAEMKKKLKKLQNMAKGLRAKVAKKVAAFEATKKESQNDEDDDDDDNNSSDDKGFTMNLFDMNISTTLEPATEIMNKVVIQYIDADIPNDWSGKTPKVMLLEHCRKQKWPKPTFTKMENTTNGCMVKVKLSPSQQQDVKIITEDGPFRSFKDAEHFVSTKALYALNPTLPMYLVMPPTFRDLWMSWLREKKSKQDDALMADENEKLEKISTLVSYLSNVVNNESTDASEPKCGPVVSNKDESAMEETFDNWDDESFGSGNSDDMQRKQLIDDSSHQTSVPTTNSGKKLKGMFINRQKRIGYEQMYRKRQQLPIFDYRQQILDTVRNNPVTVLCAETGAGKTTQCPQFILEEALLSGFGDKVNILCTQPRRISALSVAERVAEEMDDTVGKQVGYHIRMETKKSNQTKLLFCTTGVVLRRLQEDSNLEGVTHVIVDEVHERQWQIDFLLIALRRLLTTTRGKDLKVILMSATLDSKLFCSFFQNAPFLSVPGRTFPVSEYFLEDILDATDHLIDEDSKHAIRSYHENRKTSLMVTGRGGEKRKEIVSLDNESDPIEVSDYFEGYKMSTRRSMERVDEQVINYDLIEDLLSLLVHKDNNIILPPNCKSASESNLSSGSILIFLPGIGEIRSLHNRLTGNVKFGDSKRFDVIPMHSTLSPKEQKRAFMRPRQGCRKIILATNIAETSITIDDCVCVIDAGLVREVMQDQRSATSKLVTIWCSKASSKQRAGRAGRVQPGICCKLYSSRTASHMNKQSVPELQRIPLEEVCLTILAANLATNCMDFLMQAPQPPANDAVSNALKVLEEVNAIEPIEIVKRQGGGTRVEVITPLGEHLAKLPVDIRLGKMLIFGALFKVLDKTLTIAASLSSKSPFSTNIHESQQAAAAHQAFVHPTSDFLTICNVWDAYCEACNVSFSNGRRFCDKNFLNRTAFIEIGDTRKQFIQLLGQIGFVDSQHLKSVESMASSRYNINGTNENVLGTVICAGLYPNCAHVLTKYGEVPTLWQRNEQMWFHKSSVHHNKKQIDSEWIIYHDKFATHKVFISTTNLIKPFSLLLFGKSIDVQHLDRKVIVDGWIELGIPAQTGVIFRELREEMSKVLNSRISHASESESQEDVLVDGIIKLLTLE